VNEYERHMAARPRRHQDHWTDTSGLDAASQFKPYFNTREGNDEHLHEHRRVRCPDSR